MRFQGLSVDSTKHGLKSTPAASKTALRRTCCNTHAELEPLTWRDRAWISGFIVAGCAIWGLIAYAVLA